MKESEIRAVALSLSHWNPLADNAINISDLDGYKTEAIDIISSLSFFARKLSTREVISNVLSQAFRLPLDEESIKNAAEEIESILSIDAYNI